MSIDRILKQLIIFLALLLARGTVKAADAGKVNDVINKQVKVDNAAAASQKKIDQMSDRIDKMYEAYTLTLRETKNLKAYNDQLERLIASQAKEKQSIAQQISEIESTHQGVMPLIVEMIDTLDAFVKLDSPFLKDERTQRVQNLKDMMDRADVSSSEKYRRVLEAYQVENEYGRTIEAYRAALSIEGKDTTVDFLRVGRVALIYQTLDGERAAIWNQDKKTWQELDSSYAKAIRKGLRIARKQVAPSLLNIPVPGYKEASL